jgi:hypothetical protein
MILGGLSGFVERGSYASFTSSTGPTVDQFSTGTITLGAGVTSGSLALTNMVPGDTFAAQLTVQNSGSLTLRYAVSTSTTGSAPLASGLQLTIRTKTANPCSSQDGSILYGPATLSSGAVGSAAQGQQAGDRQLDPSASENLCFVVTLPTSETTVANTSTGVTFSFAAEQVVAN